MLRRYDFDVFKTNNVIELILKNVNFLKGIESVLNDHTTPIHQFHLTGKPSESIYQTFV